MEKYRKYSLFIILIPTPDFPHFCYILGGNLRSLLKGDVLHEDESVISVKLYSTSFLSFLFFNNLHKIFYRLSNILIKSMFGKNYH